MWSSGGLNLNFIALHRLLVSKIFCWNTEKKIERAEWVCWTYNENATKFKLKVKYNEIHETFGNI